MDSQVTRVREAIAPAIEAAGYDLEDVAITAAGRRSVVRVVIDADGGVDLDVAAEISREIGRRLDDTSAMGDRAYVLEVTSPGVDRPLVEARHWRRAIGRLVETSSDGKVFTGRVVSVDDSTVVFSVNGEQQSWALTDLTPGSVQIEFARTAPQ